MFSITNHEPLNTHDNDQSLLSQNIFDNLTKFNHEEYQYIHLVEDILENGEFIESRNGKTKNTFGGSMRFSLNNNYIPFITTKKLAWKTCLKELLWFISGETNNAILQEQDVNIWNANSTREFLDNHSLSHYPENILGPIYGFQWRNFNAIYDMQNGTALSNGIDQLQYIIDQLSHKETRNSRRLILTAWNPNQIDQMAIPPCHILCQFFVKNENKLSCAMYQRSVDVALGQPFNIASYSLLTHLIAHHCNLDVDEFVYFYGNAHIYNEHLDIIKEQIYRKPCTFPTIQILNKYDNINEYKITDFKINNYEYHPPIKMNMIA